MGGFRTIPDSNPGTPLLMPLQQNSVATTFYQYLKVIVLAMSSSSAVMIEPVGRGDMKRVKSDARTLVVIDLLIGVALGVALFVLRNRY